MREGDRVEEYTLHRLLGRGGMGEVWRARDGALDRWVALKVLTKAEPAELERLRREARAAAALSHPGIVRIYAVGERHIAMELIEGRTLAELTLDARGAARAVRDAAKAIAAAHAGGIVHRDLKPQNLMIDTAGHVRVMDFGLAKRVEGGESLTQTGLTVGTPAYMSPEQVRGERADELSDVYGLGATLHHLLSGNPPFEGATVIAILKGVLEREPKPTKAPGDLDAIVQKCLAKNPADRYAGAAELADDLDRWLKREPVAAKPASVVTRVARDLTKSRTRVWVAVAAAAVVAIVAGMIAVVRRGERDAREAKERLIEELRTTSATCLDAALQLRRAGNVAAMEVQAARLEAVCAQVMAAAPGLAEPHVMMGRMRRAQMQFDRALEAQEKALALEPGLPEARRERARLLQRRYETTLTDRYAAWRRGRVGERDLRDPPVSELEDVEMRGWKAQALEDFRTLGDDESRARARLIEGDAEAFRWFARAAEDPSADEEVFELRGKVALDLGRPAEAVEWYTKGHERDAGYVPHLYGRARARKFLAQNPGTADPSALLLAALDDWNAIERLGLLGGAGRHHRADAQLALSFWRMANGGDWEEPMKRAEADLEALGSSPDASVPLNRGVIELERARMAQARGSDPSAHYGRAVDWLRRATRDHPAEESAWANLAYVHANRAQYESQARRDPAEDQRAALDAISEAIRLKRSIRNYRARGKIHYNAGVHESDHGRDATASFDAAIEDLKRASAIAEEGDADTLIILGNVRSRQAAIARSPVLWRQALEAYERAVKADATNEAAWVRRAGAKATLAQSGADPVPGLRDALRDAERARALRPAFAEAWQMGGKIRFMVGSLLAQAGEPAAEEHREAKRLMEEAVRLSPSLKRELDPLIEKCAKYLASGRS